MARIDFDHIAHSYQARPRSAADYALKTMNHAWEDGGAYALLGPSGCGKTTLLNICSGLVKPSEGRILFDGQDMTRRSTQTRNIAQVFQFPVVYDTMTVYDNLAFPLRNRGWGKAQVRKRVHEVADILELGDQLGHRARGLTADRKQKISMGRGLVRSDVSAILFDEPLTVIDPQLKWQLRRSLKEIHRRLGLTLIYVTHDQTEALTFADRVAVMNDGRMLQVGTPQDLFESPAHTFVGYFIGSPGMNFLPCEVDGDTAMIDGTRIPLPQALAAAAAQHADAELKLGIRPEFTGLAAPGDDGGIPVQLTDMEDLGRFCIATVELGGQRLLCRIAETAAAPDTARPRLQLEPEWLRLYADEYLIGGGTDHG